MTDVENIAPWPPDLQLIPMLSSWLDCD